MCCYYWVNRKVYIVVLLIDIIRLLNKTNMDYTNIFDMVKMITLDMVKGGYEYEI